VLVNGTLLSSKIIEYKFLSGITKLKLIHYPPPRKAAAAETTTTTTTGYIPSWAISFTLLVQKPFRESKTSRLTNVVRFV
jgi:hypothetical protein